MMKCPIDGSDLQSREYEAGIPVDGCPSCGGVWLDPGELEIIQETNERDYRDALARMPDLGYRAYELARQKQGRMLNCPRCGSQMDKREYARCSQVMIDACPSCHGVWLDRGELESLEVFYERARLDAAELRKEFLAGLKVEIR
jgi:Zn-finger nucleic acid-binding protein